MDATAPAAAVATCQMSILLFDAYGYAERFSARMTWVSGRGAARNCKNSPRANRDGTGERPVKDHVACRKAVENSPTGYVSPSTRSGGGKHDVGLRYVPIL